MGLVKNRSQSIIEIIDQSFDQDRARYLKDLFRNRPSLGQDGDQEFINDFRLILEDLSTSQQELSRVIKQSKEAKRSRQNVDYGDDTRSAGDSGANTFLDEGAKKMPLSSNVPKGIGWQTTKETGRGLPVYLQGASGLRKKLDKIQNFDGEVSHLYPANDEYFRLLHLARGESSEKLKLNTARLENFLKNGRDLTSGEKNIYQTRVGENSAWAETMSLNAVNGVYRAFNYFGKGIYSHSDPAERSEFKKYVQKRNHYLTNLINKFGPESGGKTQFMNKFKEILNSASHDPSGLIDQNSFENLISLIEDEIKQDEHKISSGRFGNGSTISEAVKELNKEVYESAKDKAKESDDAFKFRVIQAALILTPFMGISLIGPILGGASFVFGSGGIAEGVVAIMHSFGPFSDMIKYMGLDTAVHWLLTGMPIVGDVVDLADYLITSNIGQVILGDVVFPVLGSALVPLVVAGTYSAARVLPESKFREKYNKEFQGHEKALQDLITSALKDDRVQDSNFENFVKNKYEILHKCYKNEGLTKFIGNLVQFSGDGRNLLSDILDKDMYQELVTGGILIGDYLDEDMLRSHLANIREKDKVKYDQYMDKFLTFRAIDEDLIGEVGFDRIIEQYDELDESKISDYKDKGDKLVESDIILQMARAKNLAINEDDLRDNKFEQCKDIEAQMISMEANKMKEGVERMKKDGRAVDKFNIEDFLNEVSGYVPTKSPGGADAKTLGIDGRDRSAAT